MAECELMDGQSLAAALTCLTCLRELVLDCVLLQLISQRDINQ